MSARLCDAFEAFKSLIPADLDPAALQVWKEDGASILTTQAGERLPEGGGSDQPGQQAQGVEGLGCTG